MKRKLSKIYTSYSFILFVVTLLFMFAKASSAELIPSETAPLKVVDGDSLAIGDQRIRLIGIDAPEYNQFCKNTKGKTYNCGQKAKKYLENLVKTDSFKCIAHSKDQYNRHLCTCYADKIDINAELVRQGWAVTYMDSPYKEEQTEARLNKRGIWQGKFIHPRLFRRLKDFEKSK